MTKQELKKTNPQLYDELWTEALKKAEMEVNENLDNKIAAAIDAEKENLKEEAEDVVLEIMAQREQEICEVLREIVNAIASIDGVIPEEDEDKEEYEDDENTEFEEG